MVPWTGVGKATTFDTDVESVLRGATHATRFDIFLPSTDSLARDAGRLACLVWPGCRRTVSLRAAFAAATLAAGRGGATAIGRATNLFRGITFEGLNSVVSATALSTSADESAVTEDMLDCVIRRVTALPDVIRAFMEIFSSVNSDVVTGVFTSLATTSGTVATDATPATFSPNNTGTQFNKRDNMIYPTQPTQSLD